MASGGIAIGFLLMLLLPCAITLLGGREDDEEGWDLSFARPEDPGEKRNKPAMRSHVAIAPQAQFSAAQVVRPRVPAQQVRPRVQAPVQHQAFAYSGKPMQEQPRESDNHWPVLQRRDEVPNPAPVYRPSPPRRETPAWAVPAAFVPTQRPVISSDDRQVRRETARVSSDQQLRLERAELDVLRARAIAMRAHAEALAAIARAARSRAEAAAEEARYSEHEARHMSEYVRRAA